MKTYSEIEDLIDAFEGHSDEDVPPELVGADKMTATAVLRWVLGKPVFGVVINERKRVS